MLNPIFSQHDMFATSQVFFSIMHIIITHTISCIYLANFIVCKMSCPYFSCVKCYEFPLGNIFIRAWPNFYIYLKHHYWALFKDISFVIYYLFPSLFSYRTLPCLFYVLNNIYLSLSLKNI